MVGQHLDLEGIAARISEREAQIGALMGQSLHLAALSGADLIRVKESLPGKFMGWVEANCGLNHHTVNRYMRLARKNPEYFDPDKCPKNLSINAALALIAASDDIKELVADAIAAGEVVHERTIRELSGKAAYPGKRGLAEVIPINVAPKVETWKLTAHVCRECCGRLLMRSVSPTVTEYICCKCEKRTRGDVDLACWCGKVVGGDHGKMFECIINPNPRPELPNAIMVREKQAIAKPVPARLSRYAGTGEVIDSI